MQLLFDKSFFYNWTVNSDNPGLADFFIFSLKVFLFSVLVMTIFGGSAYAETVGFLLTPLIEEHARTYWIKHAKNALRAGLMFALFISLFEFFSAARLSQGFSAAPALIDAVAVRVVPTAMHFAYTVLGYQLLRRGASAVRVWLICATVHLLFNEVLATRVADWVQSLQVGSRLL